MLHNGFRYRWARLLGLFTVAMVVALSLQRLSLASAAVAAGVDGATRDHVAALSTVNPGPTPRIISGQVAKPGQFPWMASLHWHGSAVCAGAVIAPQWILSAKHCHGGSGPSDPRGWSVRVGSTSKSRGGQVYRVSSFRDYPSAAVDLSLLKLSRPIIGARPIAYPTATTPGPNAACVGNARGDLRTCPYRLGAPAIAMGWGTLSSSSLSTPDLLRWTRVARTPDSTCSSAPQAIGHRLHGVFCAGMPRGAGAGTCAFDSGGPYVWSRLGFLADGTPRSTPMVLGTLRGIDNETCGVPGLNDDWQATGGSWSGWISLMLRRG